MRFCGFGPGHKSMHRVTKVFRDEIKEAFGLEHDKYVGDDLEVNEPRDGNRDESEHADDKDFEDKSDGDGESEENSDDSEADIWDRGDDLEYFAFEEELGYAPL